jgi:hypothetical protein
LVLQVPEIDPQPWIGRVELEVTAEARYGLRAVFGGEGDVGFAGSFRGVAPEAGWGDRRACWTRDRIMSNDTAKRAQTRIP